MSADGTRVVTVVGTEIWFWPVGFPLEPVPAGRVLPVDVPYTLSPNGARIAVYDSAAGEIDIWEVDSRALSRTLRAPADVEATALAFDATGRYLAVASGDAVRMWDVDVGYPVGPRLVAPYGATGRQATDVRFSPDGEWLYVQRDGGGITSWRITDKEPAGSAP